MELSDSWGTQLTGRQEIGIHVLKSMTVGHTCRRG